MQIKRQNRENRTLNQFFEKHEQDDKVIIIIIIQAYIPMEGMGFLTGYTQAPHKDKHMPYTSRLFPAGQTETTESHSLLS